MGCKQLITFLLFILFSNAAVSQNLNKTVSLEINNQRLDYVLEILSNKGNFYFSYNGNIIKRDSLVTLSASNKTIKQVLDMLLPDNYEFKETGNYIIIRKAPVTIKLVTNKATTEDKFYVVSGYVLDDNTGMHVQNASIYEKDLLVSALTNARGYFKLALKQKKKTAALTVSKEFYQDTTVYIEPGYNQQITVTIVPVSTGVVTIISPEDYFAPDQLKLRVQTDSTITEYTYTKTDSIKVERTAFGRLFLSSKQHIQSLNLRKFFTSRPFQLSLTPGLGTHGKLSAQVINNFSFNVFGGYNGGVNGLELGGLFNIDKKNVQYVQIAGLTNLVGGKVKGLQIAGIGNTVLDSMSGVQIAGVFNYAKRMKGVQIGLINISDTLDGIGIGLINIVLKGYHKLSVYADEVVYLNGAFKTGSGKLYNILQAGINPQQGQKVFTFGYGLGSEIKLGKMFTINPELSAQHLYLGSWDYTNILSKARLNFNIRFGKYVSIFAGPVFNAYYSKQDMAIAGYKSAIPPAGYRTYDLGTNVKGWLGWSAGINFF